MTATIWWRCEMCGDGDAEGISDDEPVLDLLHTLDEAHGYASPDCHKTYGHRYMRLSLGNGRNPEP